MSKLLIALLVAAGVGIAGPAAAQTNAEKATSTPMTNGHIVAKTNADAQYKIDKEACSSMNGNAKDICLAQAKGKDNVARADADAAFENTPKSHETARVAHAQAIYDVNREKCDDLAGNRKDVCIKEAKGELVKAKANAKVDRVASDVTLDSETKKAHARKEASADKRVAEQKVAMQKCDALEAAAKDACVGNAKVQFGK